MSVSRATVARRARRPARPWCGPARGRRSTDFMKAPEPTLTSRTSAPVPSAIFLLMIELAISGIASTVPVTSRSAYSLRSAGASPSPAAQIDRADVAQLGDELVVGQRGPPAGDRLQLVQRAAGVAEPPAGQLRYGRAAGRHQRGQRQRDLVADAAGGVLVDRRAAHRRQVQPLAGGDHRGGPAGDLAGPSCRAAGSPWPARTSARRRPPPGVRVDHPVDLRVARAPRRRAWPG